MVIIFLEEKLQLNLENGAIKIHRNCQKSVYKATPKQNDLISPYKADPNLSPAPFRQALKSGSC